MRCCAGKFSVLLLDILVDFGGCGHVYLLLINHCQIDVCLYIGLKKLFDSFDDHLAGQFVLRGKLIIRFPQQLVIFFWLSW